MPYLHLPVQAGSDRILKAMNRRHKAEDYLRLIERIRAARPDMAMSGDFIVGFPGETDADFEATLGVGAGRFGYAQAFSFKYSPRPGTPGAEMKDHVVGSGEGRAAAAAAGAARPNSCSEFNAAMPVGMDHRRADREARSPAGPARRPLALAAAGDC